jgi:hypothetical protein
VSQRVVKLLGGEQVQAPAQALVNIPAGKHTIGFGGLAQYSSSAPGDVFVAPVSLVAITLPAH